MKIGPHQDNYKKIRILKAKGRPYKNIAGKAQMIYERLGIGTLSDFSKATLRATI